MNYYWSNLHSLHWPDDWIIFKWLPAKMPAVSERGGMQIIQIVSGGRNCTSRQINKSSDSSVHSQLLYEFPHQGAQSYFFFLKEDGFYYEKVRIFHNKNSEVNTTKQKCSHAHNSGLFSVILPHIFHSLHPFHCVQKVYLVRLNTSLHL